MSSPMPNLPTARTAYDGLSPGSPLRHPGRMRPGVLYVTHQLVVVHSPASHNETLVIAAEPGKTHERKVFRVEAAYAKVLLDHRASNQHTYALFSDADLVHQGSWEVSLAAVKMDAPLPVVAGKPTLFPQQGVIVVRVKHTKDGTRYAVIYDPTDPITDDCQWPPGTVITDLTPSMLVLGYNWRARILRRGW